MRLARIRRVVVIALAGVLLHGAAAWASSVSVPLGQTVFGAMVVDETNQHVFVSNPSGNSISVFGFSGNPVTTISGLPGADGMVIRGSTLYVADSTGGAIEAIDLSSLEDTGSVATGLDDPTVLAYAAGKLWTTSDAGNGFSRLTSVGFDGTVTVVPVSDATEYQHPVLASDPANADLLYAAGGAGVEALSELDVSSGTPTVVASAELGSVVISPDGTRAILDGGGGGIGELNAANLTSDGTQYQLPGFGASAGAVAVSPGDGGLMVAAGTYQSLEPTDELDVFKLGTATATSTVVLPGTSGILSTALTADGSIAFAIGQINAVGQPLRLWTANLGTSSTDTTTSLASAQAPSTTDNQVTLTATVSPTDGGGSVSFYGNYSPIAGCSSVPLVNTPGGETATCTTTSLSASADDVVTAYYSGDGAYSTSLASTSVAVELPTGSDYTWTGGGTEDNLSDQQWSDPSNWAQAVIPYGAVGTLSFSGVSCAGYSCGCSYGVCSASNDISGLTANALDIDSSTPFDISGDGLTLGAGGLTVEGEPSGGTTPSTLDLPLTLASPQTWTIEEADTPFQDAVSGDEPLTVDFSNGSSVLPSGGFEVGDLTATGDGGFYLDGGMDVNSTDSSPIELDSGGGIEADQGNNDVGPVTVGSGGWLSVGGIADGGSSLAVDGKLAFSSGSELDLSVASPGTSAGVDYSQLTATGNIDLSGAGLYVSQGADDQGYCDNLNPGDTLTLLSTSGTITGTFASYPNGASVDIANNCDTSTQDATGTIDYTPNAVTLTITNGGNAGGNGGNGGTGPNPPVEVNSPSLSGTAQEGQTLQVDPGTWEQESSFEYSWWACDADGNCTQIPNASSSSLQLTSAQLGDQVGAIVTADGPGGSNSDYTNISDTVAAEPVPTIASPPMVSGSPGVGTVLAASNGSWTNSPTSYAYQWERCSTTGTSCSAIAGATTSTYTATSADDGSTLEVQVTASNFGGKSSPASSSATGVVPITATATIPTTAPAASTTPAAITTALRSVLSPRGKTGSLTAVIRHHGYTFSFQAPAAGRLAVTWTATVKHKQITIAKGAASTTGPQRMKISVRLTRAGVAALKRYPRLRIRSVLRFTASGLQQIVASRTFTLRGSGSARKARAITLRRITGSVVADRGRPHEPVRVRRSDFRSP